MTGGNDDGGVNWLSTGVMSGAVASGVVIVIIGGGTCLIVIFKLKRKKTNPDGKCIYVHCAFFVGGSLLSIPGNYFCSRDIIFNIFTLTDKEKNSLR